MRHDPYTTGQTTFVLGKGVIDGTGSGLRQGDGILMRDGVVIAVGTPGNIESSDSTRVNIGANVIVPGFVNAHTHVTTRPWEGDQHGQKLKPYVWQAIRGVDNLRLMISSGVTTARTMRDEADIDLEYRAAIARGEIAGPKLHVAGTGFSPPGGHGSTGDAVAGVENLRAAVREHVQKGVDHIKIFATGGVSSEESSVDDSLYSDEEIAAIIDESSKAGLKVSAHAHGGRGLQLALSNGIHSIEHGNLISEENAAEMVSRGTWLVMTSSILFHPTGIEQGDGASPKIMAKVKSARLAAERAAQVVRAAGVRLAVGTDAMHGLIGYEIQRLVE